MIHDPQIDAIQADTKIVIKSWLNANVQRWGKAVLKATRHAAVKDDSGQQSVVLIHSNVNLKELSETAYREKTNGLDLTKEYSSEEKPPIHSIVMAISFLIYELNKCALSFTDQNVVSCAAMMDVCKSFVKHEDKYLDVYNALPTQAITDQLAKIKIKESINSDQQALENNHKKQVSNMKTLEDLRIVLIQLVTAAKSESITPLMSSQCSSITSALKDFNWAEYKVGTRTSFFV